MKTYQLIDTKTLEPVWQHPNPNSGQPATWLLPDTAVIPVASDGLAYVLCESAPDYDPATQAIEREVTLEKYGWKVRDLTTEELAARQPDPLTQARAGLASLLSALPVESRAKFAPIRASVELMMNNGDIEAALLIVSQVTPANAAETKLKSTITAALSQFLPA